MRDIDWRRRELEQLIHEAMFDDRTAAVARDWAADRSIVHTSMVLHCSTRTVDRCRRKIRDAYDALTVECNLQPRKTK